MKIKFDPGLELQVNQNDDIFVSLKDEAASRGADFIKFRLIDGRYIAQLWGDNFICNLYWIPGGLYGHWSEKMIYG